MSTLQKKLAANEFVITAEMVPPKVPDLSLLDKHIENYREGVDAVNILDMPSATLRMSSLGAAIYVKQKGLEPVFQMTCRDRNKLAMQADIISAHAHGIRNILCLTGDYVTLGDHPMSKPVYDMDSTNLIMMVNQLRSVGRSYAGKKIADNEKDEAFKMDWCIGAAANPVGNKPHHLARTLNRKAEAGVDFIQTQPVFDLELFDQWWQALDKEGIHQKVKIIPGILPPRSLRALTYMLENVPGIWAPKSMIKRIENSSSQAEEGIELSLEIMRHLKENYPIAGFHFYPLKWTETVPRMLNAFKLN